MCLPPPGGFINSAVMQVPFPSAAKAASSLTQNGTAEAVPFQTSLVFFPKCFITMLYGLLGSVFQKSMPAAWGPTSIVATVFNAARSITSTVPGSVPTPSTEMKA